MAKYVSGNVTSDNACWYIDVAGTITNGVGEYTRFLLSTDDAGLGFNWDTEDVNYACEVAPVTVLNSVKWEKTGVVERKEVSENTRGHAVTEFLQKLADKAKLGDSVNEHYQAWVLYSNAGGAAGDGWACLCTIQITSETAAAGEKRGFEFDILPVGTPVKVSVAAESVNSTTNEIEVTASAASVGP